jgi:hypothetical protein
LALRCQEDLALAYKWLEDNPVYWQRRAKALHPGKKNHSGNKDKNSRNNDVIFPTGSDVSQAGYSLIYIYI